MQFVVGSISIMLALNVDQCNSMPFSGLQGAPNLPLTSINQYWEEWHHIDRHWSLLSNIIGINAFNILSHIDPHWSALHIDPLCPAVINLGRGRGKKWIPFHEEVNWKTISEKNISFMHLSKKIKKLEGFSEYSCTSKCGEKYGVWHSSWNWSGTPTFWVFCPLSLVYALTCLRNLN